MVAQRLADGMVAHGSASAVPRLSLLVSPQVHPSADVHEFSFIEGDVQLGASVMVAPGTAITAESGASVMVGEGCSLLPGVVVEGLAGTQVSSGPGGSAACSVWLGDRAVIAHKALIHSPAFIGDGCFVGFRSTVFNARLGKGCVVMMHALVQDVELPPGKCVPSGSVITSQHQADQLPDVRPEDLEFAREVTGSTYAAGSASRNLPRNARGPSSSSTAKSSRSKARLVPVSGRSTSPSNSQFNSHSSSYGQNAGLRASGHGSFSQMTASQTTASQATTHHSSYATEGANMQATRSQSQRLAPEVVQQVRQYLSQGYRVGMEHADTRRYRSGVWETCTPIKDTREQAVLEGLERCLAEHVGEYVRIFGINTQAKSRVGMTTVQRPDGQPVNIETRSVPAASASANGGGYAQSNNGGGGNANAGGGALAPDVVQQVRNLLRSGYIIGTEHADARRYRSNVWKSCSPINSTNEQEVFSRLEHCLAEHSGEYIRMFGIDTQAKRRMTSVTIQRADGKPVEVAPTNSPAASASSSQGGSYSQSYSQGTSGGGSNSGAAQAVNQILAQGNTVGVEIADARRYRSGIWQTAPSVQSASQLQAVLAQNADKYVRIFGVNKAMKTRGSATTVQKPGQKADAPTQGGNQGSRDPINANPPHYDDPAFLKNNGNSGGNGAVDSDVMNQVTQLVNQGCRISIEFADKRRYRSGIWKTGPAIESRRPADAISALSQQLAQHQGDYVRLIGVDPQAKRRVLEATIQRP